MKKLFAAILICSSAFAGELHLIDATGGASMKIFMQAAMFMSAEEEIEVSMKRDNSANALKSLDEGRCDAVIIETRFISDKSTVQLPWCAEALTLYISTANPGADISKSQVLEILKAHRPTWKAYNHLDMDIQRIAPKYLAQGGTLIGRVFGEFSADDEIFRVETASSGFAFVNSASIFFAGFTAMPPASVKPLKINGIMPTSSSVREGTYPLALRYVIAYREKTPELVRLVRLISTEKYRQMLRDDNMLDMLPEKF